MMKRFIFAVTISSFLMASGANANAESNRSLQEAFQDHFMIGAALNPSHTSGRNPARTELITSHFNTITPENVMKWQPIHPRPGDYNFSATDAFVEFGETHGMFIVGHTLVWHSQTPGWVFEDGDGNPLDREALLERMRDHIHTVVGRYKGRVHGWDVVNEALNEDGSLRNSPWRRIIGDDYLIHAFRFAHEADPDAELYYNDYSIENPRKRNGAVRLLQNLLDADVPITGVGIQGHGNLSWPSLTQVDQTIQAFADLGLRVMITELDISVLPSRTRTVSADIGGREQAEDRLNPYTDGLPDEMQEVLARRYADLFNVYLKHSDVVDRVTFWGVSDGSSWLNNFPIRGRTNYPLLFDRQWNPKPAFQAVLEAPRRFATAAIPRTFTNPVIPGFHADPSLIRVGDDYYTVHSTFEYFPGVFIMHSRDLVNWRQLGNVLDRDSQLQLGNVPSSGGIFAPTIRYHDGTFYMFCTVVWGGGNFYVTATDPAGPWSEPVWLDSSGIDPSIFFDDDGTVYYHRQVDGERGFTGQQEIDLETGELVGEMKEIWRGTGGIWPEGPHIYKLDDTYYLLISEGGTSYGHMVTVARSDSPWGPFESNPSNPILTHRHLEDHPFQALGHADFVETPDGWWTVFLGFRPQGGNFHHIGRETFLAPVSWDDDGWPVINNNEPIRETMPAPRLPEHPWPEEPVRQSFDSENLPPWWQYIRNPTREHYSFSERPGWLRLHGSEANLSSDRASPTFLGRRQTGLNCRVATRLSFDPENENEEAGIALRGNESHHTLLGVRVVDGERHAFLRVVQQGEANEVLSHEPIPDGDVILSVEAEPLSYEFFYQTAGRDRQSLGVQPTRELSSENIGSPGMSFTGVYFGMYATGNGSRSSAPADFRWFEYEPKEDE